MKKTLLFVLLASLIAAFGCHPSESGGSASPEHRFGASAGLTASQRAAIATTTWYVGCAACGGTASDSNNGTSATTPLATFGEIARRYGPGIIRIPQATTINVQGDIADAIDFRLSLPIGVKYTIQGAAKATLASGTLTARTALAPASNTPNDITAGAIGDWATACTGGTDCTGKQLVLSDGKSAWLVKKTAATVERTSTFGTAGASTWSASDPAGNETFTVSSYYTVPGVNVEIYPDGYVSTLLTDSSPAFRIDLLDIGDQSGTNRRAFYLATIGNYGAGNYPLAAVTRSSVTAEIIAGNFSALGSKFTAASSISTTATPVSLFLSGCYFAKPFTIGGGQVFLHGGTLFQGAGLTVVEGGLNTGTNGFAVFDSTAAGLLVANSRIRLGLANGAWGSGNATYGWNLLGGAHIIYSGAPSITGTSGDIIVGSKSYLYSSQLPVVDPAADVFFIPQTPVLGSLSNVQCGTSTLVAGTKTINTGITVTASSRVVAQYNTRAGATTGVRIDIPSASRVAGAPGTGSIVFNSVDVSGSTDTNDTSTFDYCIFN